jgi:sugar O-acyltransferase (sialic acid O-acetyltransferase NeuD family)
MKKALIGAGGFAREVKAHMNEFDMISFVDDEYYNEDNKNTLPLSQFNPDEYEVLIAIGNPIDRMNIVKKLPTNTKYFTFIHPTVQILGNDVLILEGSFIGAGCILTTNITLGRHTHLNLHTTIGHDCFIDDFLTSAPGVKVSGNCNIYKCVYLGTNSSIKQKINICSFTTIGMGAAVVNDIYTAGTYVGVPAKLLKSSL